jgi:hypothetical protein
MHGLIDRRLLLNFSADPAVVQRLLPAPFRPKLHAGRAIVGICLIRLSGLRPRWVPRCLGVTSENAAHRIAVAWDENGVERTGVYVLRRDTASRLNVLVGGRLFPGMQRHATFTVQETPEHLAIAVTGADVRIDVAGTLVDDWPTGSVFADLATASAFFAEDADGYAVTARADRLDGLRLCCEQWAVRPMRIDRVASSFYDDARVFPPGSIRPDCALVMTGIQHHWERLPPRCCTPISVAGIETR